MKVVIIEDEKQAAKVLTHLLHEIEPSINIIAILDSVREGIEFFNKTQIDYDLVFMDIQLADGNSFKILESCEPKAPIIFTTAFDEYAIKAFKTNSIDYLLKPINEEELKYSLKKFERNRQKQLPENLIKAVLEQFQNKQKIYSQSILAKSGKSLIPVNIQDIACFFIKDGIVRAKNFQNKNYLLDKKLDGLEVELDPKLFFRVNRQFIFQRRAIKSLHKYFQGKLILKSEPKSEIQIVVSSAKASALKKWLS